VIETPSPVCDHVGFFFAIAKTGVEMKNAGMPLASRFSKLALAALTLGTGFIVAGCQSENANDMTSHEMGSKAAHCDKCETTWVQTSAPSAKGSPILAYTANKHMVCPDCKDAVSNFFATGNLKHECKTCGGNMAACEGH
jgi:hypothetical protein